MACASRPALQVRDRDAVASLAACAGDRRLVAREATFFVVGPQNAPLVIAVVPEAQPYTVRLPATGAASNVETETGV